MFYSNIFEKMLNIVSLLPSTGTGQLLIIFYLEFRNY